MIKELIVWFLFCIAIVQPWVFRYIWKDINIEAAGYLREDVRATREKQITDIQIIRASINRWENEIAKLQERYASNDTLIWQQVQALHVEVSALKRRLDWIDENDTP